MKRWIALLMVLCLLMGSACAEGIIGSADGPVMVLPASDSHRVTGVVVMPLKSIRKVE